MDCSFLKYFNSSGKNTGDLLIIKYENTDF